MTVNWEDMLSFYEFCRRKGIPHRRAVLFTKQVYGLITYLEFAELEGMSRDKAIELLKEVMAVSYTHLTLPTTERV